MTNPDQGLLRSFDPACGKPRVIDSSPFALALGGQLHRLDRERGLIELQFTPGERFLQGAQPGAEPVASATSTLLGRSPMS